MSIASHILDFYDVDYDKVRKESFPPQVRQVIDLVNRKVAAQSSLEDVMNFLFDVTREINPSDRIGLAFVEEEGERVVSRFVRANYRQILLGEGYTEDIRRSTLKQVIADKKVRVIHDLIRYLNQNPDSKCTRILLEEGVRSSMTCPLIVEGRTVALLFRSSRVPSAFDERAVKQHMAIAERLSQAVDKAYRMEQLEQASKSYMEMLGFVSHELKSPLASIVMDGNLLTEGYLGDLDDKQLPKIKNMVARAEYLLDLVREYLDLARIEGGKLRLHVKREIDLFKDVIDPAIEVAMHDAEQKRMKLHIHYSSKPLKVELDPDLIKIVVVNLLTNAVKYGFDYGDILILVRLDNDELTVSVKNEGFGFSEPQKSLLFRKFSRLSTSTLHNKRSTGIGLFTCWRIIRLHGGIIEADSQLGQWAEFTFRIPQPLSLNGMTTDINNKRKD